MTAHAYSRLPYWRWWRHAKKRVSRRPGAIAKPWNGLVLVAALLTLDLVTKTQMTTLFPAHAQPTSWIVTPTILALILLPLVLTPLWMGAAVSVAGVLGNATSIAVWGAAENPFMYADGNDIVVFNVADICIWVGFVLVLTKAVRLAVTHRPRRQP